MTCSRVITNEVGHCLTRSDNAYFANSEQASLAIFTATFCFAHADYNLIKLKLCTNWSAQAVMWNLSKPNKFAHLWKLAKPIKFAHLWKLANQSTLNKAHLIEITKACAVAFMKVRNSLAVRCRKNVSIGKKQKMVKIYFLKLQLIFRFWLTSKSCSRFNKVVHDKPSIK